MLNTTESRELERSHIQALATAMCVHSYTDPCGDPFIKGSKGNIHTDGSGYSVYVQRKTKKTWTNAKKLLTPFCILKQDGDVDGVLHLPSIPPSEHLTTLRECLRVRKIIQYTPEVLEKKIAIITAARRLCRQ
mgnify:CR=1 FL=1